jgi:tRNA pseudouridine38-40 synthase
LHCVARCSYVGTDFRGLQLDRTEGIRTVEGELEKALFAAGAIAESNYGDLSKIGWSRTSRYYCYD